jgi:hypothetical protein
VVRGALCAVRWWLSTVVSWRSRWLRTRCVLVLGCGARGRGTDRQLDALRVPGLLRFALREITPITQEAIRHDDPV